jgi:hypothetical protein
MSDLPNQKLLKIIKGATFDYTFQFSLGQPGSSSTFNLTNYTGSWVITPGIGSPITYTTGGSAGASGVFFGGDAGDPTNGMIDLVISASDTAVIPWTIGTYTFSIASGGVVTELLSGGIGIAGSL